MHSAEEGWASFCTCNQQSEKLWTLIFEGAVGREKILLI